MDNVLHFATDRPEQYKLLGDHLLPLRDRCIPGYDDLQTDDNPKFWAAYKIGTTMGVYVANDKLLFEEERVTTPMNVDATEPSLQDHYGAYGIKRAAQPLTEGLAWILDIPERYTTLSRDDTTLQSHEKHTEDLSVLNGRHVFVNDIMLAGGDSMVTGIDVLTAYADPADIDIIAVCATEEGIQYVQDYARRQLGGELDMWVAVIDPVLDENGFIKPGVGDAGDAIFGTKEEEMKASNAQL